MAGSIRKSANVTINFEDGSQQTFLGLDSETTYELRPRRFLNTIAWDLVKLYRAGPHKSPNSHVLRLRRLLSSFLFR